MQLASNVISLTDLPAQKVRYTINYLQSGELNEFLTEDLYVFVDEVIKFQEDSDIHILSIDCHVLNSMPENLLQMDVYTRARLVRMNLTIQERSFYFLQEDEPYFQPIRYEVTYMVDGQFKTFKTYCIRDFAGMVSRNMGKSSVVNIMRIECVILSRDSFANLLNGKSRIEALLSL